jgi:hypothetical protein
MAAAVARKAEKKAAALKLEESERQARLEAQATIQKQREVKEAELADYVEPQCAGCGHEESAHPNDSGCNEYHLEVPPPPPNGGSSKDPIEDDLPF